MQKNLAKENTMMLNGYYNLVIPLQKEEISIVTVELERIQNEYDKIKKNK